MSEIIEIDSISTLHRMLGDEKPGHPLATIIDFTNLKIPMPSNEIRVRTDLYSVMLKRHVSGEYTYGRKSMDFHEGALFCTAPGQISTYSNDSGFMESEGIILYFHPDLLSRYQLGKSIYDYSFFHYEADEALHLSDKEKETLLSIIDKIKTELQDNMDDFTRDLIVSNIELLLNYIKRYYSRQFITRKDNSMDVVVRFERFIRDYINSDKLKKEGVPSVSYCAEKMCYSPNYLGDLLRKETGKNTHEHIQDRLMEKAKSLLLGSEMSVSEIAYDLGFEYPHYFSKVFKKRVGITPGKYKNSGDSPLD